ncbi:MAG: hypothetical protein PHG16_06220 [Lachnospiraceae bacterium]|nr:hypothetical protein [Lachnospiraceae bacterium]
MTRFVYTKSPRKNKNILWSILIFALLILALLLFISRFSHSSLQEQKASLEQSLRQGAVHCYAVSGSYPESLAILLEQYGISYDKNSFFVDYQPLGANVMPDITVIARKGADAL